MKISNNTSLKQYNTFALDIAARRLIEVENDTDFIKLEEILAEKDEDTMILGGGSNILFTKDFEGTVVIINLKGINIIEENNEHVVIDIMSGENWHELVMYCVEKGWGGIENLAFIPGKVGACPVQNIGAYGVEIKDTLTQVKFFNLDTKQIETFTNEQCRFSYRDSIFKHELKNKVIITSIQLKLSKHPKLNTSYGNVLEEMQKLGKPEDQWTIKDIAEVVTNIRKTKLPDPKVIPTAGSFFKNPIINMEQFKKLKAEYPDIPDYPVDDKTTKLAAGWLIDQCGWKGWTSPDGTYGVHKQHALVLVNYGDANGMDIVNLAKDIQKSVKEKFGVEIEPEVNIY